MLQLLLITLLAAPQAPRASDWLADDPYAAPLFDELRVVEAGTLRRVPALARQVDGRAADGAFVNVLRWTDARPFRGKKVAIRQSAQLAAAASDTSARLWVRTLRADGAQGFRDDGHDQRARTPEDSRIESVLAIAQDATDLAFGLIIQGATTVYIGQFELEVLGDAEPDELCFSVPARFVDELGGRHGRSADPGGELDLRWMAFVPAGIDPSELPIAFEFAAAPDTHKSFERGRAALARMRVGRDPAVALVFVEPSRAAQPEELARALRRNFAARLAPACLRALGRSPGAEPALLFAPSDEMLAALFAASLPELGAARIIEPVGSDMRQGLRRVRALHDAARLDSPELAELLYAALLEELALEVEQPTVDQASHALDGHSCDHDHPHAPH